MSSKNSNTITSKNSNTKKDNKSKDSTLQKIVNYGTLIFILFISYIIYIYFIERPYVRIRGEGFKNIENFDNSQTIVNKNKNSNTNTIYENSIIKIFDDNIRLKCSMLPNLSNTPSACLINNETFVPYLFPVHIIKLIDGTILAVFNDGRLYTKDNILSTMWAGPIINSKPQDLIPLRMVTLKTDLVTLLAVGFDNILYMKTPDEKGNINLKAEWQQVPNNSDIIYVLFDNDTNYLISIDINGKLFIKNSFDITTNNQELNTKIDRPVLRLYYDLNGYMLALDSNFDLYQFDELSWKTSNLNTERGANSSKIHDLLYDNDGKMYGLIFNPDAYMVQIMKQTSIFYLADFIELNLQISSNDSSNFVMSDQDIISCKVGSIYDYLSIANANDINDDDPNFAYHKQLIENTQQLRDFCANKNSVSSNNYDNYDTLANVDKNDVKITKLKNIINTLLTYEPNSKIIKENNPIISN
jgi:hypothetical protein